MSWVKVSYKGLVECTSKLFHGGERETESSSRAALVAHSIITTNRAMVKDLWKYNDILLPVPCKEQ